MHRWIPSLTALLLATCVAGPTRGADEPRKIDNQEWIARDVAVAKKIVATIPPSPKITAKEWLALLAPNRSEPHDLGFGATRHEIALYGGYTTTWVTVVTFLDALVSITVWNPLSDDEVPVLGATLSPIWSKIAALQQNTFRYEYRSPENRTALDAARARALPPIMKDTVTIPEEYRTAYELLTAPAADLAFGDMCGYAGTPPAGRQEIEQLVTGKQVVLIRSVLRGANPVGRVYAAAALQSWAHRDGTALDAADARVIEQIRALPLEITACSGCSHYGITAAQLLDQQAAQRNRSKKDDDQK